MGNTILENILRRLTKMIFAFRPLEGGYDIPMRVVAANIPYDWLIYIFMFIPLGLFAYGVYLRIRIWTLAKGYAPRNDNTFQRIFSFLKYSFAHLRVIRRPLAGWNHFFLFWGFVLLFIATISFASWDKIGFPPLTGNFYIFLSSIIDIFGFLAIIGITVLAIIRYIVKPDRLNDSKPLDGWILVLIWSILVTGYILEGLRIAGQIQLSTSLAQISYEQLASPVGWVFALPFASLDLSSILLSHRVLWWFHMVISFIFIAIIPFTKLWHIFTSMIKYFARNFNRGAVRMVENIEEAETFGVEVIEDFAWHDLLDLDACIRCGRCQEACPAYNTGKALNPKVTLIQAMKKHLDAKAPYLLKVASSGGGGTEELSMTLDDLGKSPLDAHLIYDIVTPQVLWDCTNCGGCVEHCPMFIEHINKIIDMRRNLVMWQGDMPSEAQNTLTNLERNYNPWGVGWANRADWLQERNIRDKINLLGEDEGEFEYLLYGGCAVSFDDRYKRVGEALVNLLNEAGVKFAYLGTEEVCCGDPPRRLGNEYLFQTLAKQNIETFNNYNVKKIITICPHGYNTLKNEYPQMDGNYEVYHYTEVLAKLIAKDKIRAKQKIAKVCYHDSCFLGRHNGIYMPPREVIKSAGADIIEIDKSKAHSFCCGAGGGRMWLEEEAVPGFMRINETRTEQLLICDPEFIVTNCPYCLTMLDDGVKGQEIKEAKVVDVAEFLWERVR